MTELNIYFVKKIYKNFHDGIKYIFCGKFLHSPNFFEKWIFKLVVVLVRIIFCDFSDSILVHDVRESTDTYTMYDPNIYGTHGTHGRTSVTIIIYIYETSTGILAKIKFYR